MTPFSVDFIRFDGFGAEALVERRVLQAQTVFEAEREALRVSGDAAMGAEFDAAFLSCEGPRVRRWSRNADGVGRWGRA